MRWRDAAVGLVAQHAHRRGQGRGRHAASMPSSSSRAARSAPRAPPACAAGHHKQGPSAALRVRNEMNAIPVQWSQKTHALCDAPRPRAPGTLSKRSCQRFTGIALSAIYSPMPYQTSAGSSHFESTLSAHAMAAASAPAAQQRVEQQRNGADDEDAHDHDVGAQKVGAFSTICPSPAWRHHLARPAWSSKAHGNAQAHQDVGQRRRTMACAAAASALRRASAARSPARAALRVPRALPAPWGRAAR